MKKCPKSLTLVLMTSLAIGTAGCSDEPEKTATEEFRTFTNVAECIRSGAFTDEQCVDEFKQALAQTPQFGSLTDCEKAFGEGNCGTNPLGQPENSAAQVQAQNTPQDAAQNATAAAPTTPAYTGGGSWMPLMAGYMMGRFFSGGNTYQGSQPLFRDTKTPPAGGAGGAAGTSFRTATGDTVQTDKTGRVTNPGTAIRNGFKSTAKPVSARGTTTSRSGFGGTSSGKTSGS